MDYVFVLKDGKRVTSLVVGVHGNSLKEILEGAKLDYPGCEFLTGDDEYQDNFMSGKAWDGKEFYTPAPPPVDIEAVRRATLERVRQWTEEHIAGGFYSGGVKYDSDMDTQITMQGICLSVDSDRFKEEYPQGAPVRGYDSGSDVKTVHWLDADGVKAFCADMSQHIGNSKKIGWKLQKAAETADSIEALEAIEWPEEE